jgi:CRISPR-associated endoribonuclease Cas6
LLFRLEALRFSFVAREAIHFAEGKSSNILRGAFGTIFRRIACMPECPGASVCEWRANCPYARMFEPAATAPGPSGLADWPRPFVFRAMHLDGQTFAAGAAFHFDLNLFDTESPAIAYFILTFAQLARDGLGPGRRKIELATVARLDERGEPVELVYENGCIQNRQAAAPLALELAAAQEKVSRLRVRFLTPTELKSGQQIAPRPEFGILAARVRDRISTLRELYGGGPLAIDFREFGERASLVKMTRCEIEGIDIRRRSSRTGQVHPIGGFVGAAEYEGELSEFVAYLRVGQWTGVGRQTVWGKGAIEVKALG